MGDIWVPRLAIFFLGLVAVSATIFMGIIGEQMRDIPPAIASIGTGAVTGLASIVGFLSGKSNGTSPTSPIVLTK